MILHDLNDRHDIFTKSLHPSATIHGHHGTLSHKDIIGKRVRDIVETSQGVPMRIFEPTLDEYVRYTPRLVTPVREPTGHVYTKSLADEWHCLRITTDVYAPDIPNRCKHDSEPT